MPNGNDMLSDITFEDKLRALQGDELGRFIARQLYDHCEDQRDFSERIAALESKDKKFAGAIGGASGVFGAALMAVINRIFPTMAS